jgi:hypothetical protein
MFTGLVVLLGIVAIIAGLIRDADVTLGDLVLVIPFAMIMDIILIIAWITTQ